VAFIDIFLFVISQPNLFFCKFIELYYRACRHWAATLAYVMSTYLSAKRSLTWACRSSHNSVFGRRGSISHIVRYEKGHLLSHIVQYERDLISQTIWYERDSIFYAVQYERGLISHTVRYERDSVFYAGMEETFISNLVSNKLLVFDVTFVKLQLVVISIKLN